MWNILMYSYRKPSLSQKLSELAQHVDFRDDLLADGGNTPLQEDGNSSGPTTKKSTQRWPWEFTHSKLK